VFIRNRARIIVIKRVINELHELKKHDLWFNSKIFGDVITFYDELLINALAKLQKVKDNYEKVSQVLDTKLAEKSIFTLEYNIINDMLEKWIISDKLHVKLKHEIEENFYSDVKDNLETFCW
jgi:hypothetical protein